MKNIFMQQNKIYKIKINCTNYRIDQFLVEKNNFENFIVTYFKVTESQIVLIRSTDVSFSIHSYFSNFYIIVD